MRGLPARVLFIEDGAAIRDVVIVSRAELLGRDHRYGPGMDSAGYLAHLRRDLGAFEACLAADLAAPVGHCGDWTLADLAGHLGQGNLWAAAAVTQKRGDYQAPAAPRDPAALARWFGDTSGVLLAALDTDPSASAWTLAPPPT